MAEERAPRLCNDLSADPVYAEVGMQRRAGAGSYLGVPLELSDGSRVGSLAALSEQAARFRESNIVLPPPPAAARPRATTPRRTPRSSV